MIDEAQKALEEAEALKKLPARQEPVLDSSKYTAADVRIMSPTDSKLQVWDICGPFLSVYDRKREARAANLTNMMRGERSRDQERESSCDQDQANSRDRGRDYDQRNRDRDRYNDRECGTDYERPRTYDSRCRHRSCSRSKEYSRDYDCHRDAHGQGKPPGTPSMI
ncbi:hypothetical protein SLE2022_336150 [Rubroshorea leprosula]